MPDLPHMMAGMACFWMGKGSFRLCLWIICSIRSDSPHCSCVCMYCMYIYICDAFSDVSKNARTHVSTGVGQPRPRTLMCKSSLQKASKTGLCMYVCIYAKGTSSPVPPTRWACSGPSEQCRGSCGRDCTLSWSGRSPSTSCPSWPPPASPAPTSSSPALPLRPRYLLPLRMMMKIKDLKEDLDERK